VKYPDKQVQIANITQGSGKIKGFNLNIKDKDKIASVLN